MKTLKKQEEYFSYFEDEEIVWGIANGRGQDIFWPAQVAFMRARPLIIASRQVKGFFKDDAPNKKGEWELAFFPHDKQNKKFKTVTAKSCQVRRFLSRNQLQDLYTYRFSALSCQMSIFSCHTSICLLGKKKEKH